MTDHPRPMSDRPVSKDTPDRTDACPDVRLQSDSDVSDTSDAQSFELRRTAALARVTQAKSNFSRVAVNFLKDEFTEEQVTAAVRDLDAARQALRDLLEQDQPTDEREAP